jgi:hypothetical protein
VLAASPETSLQFFLDKAFCMDTQVDGRDVPGSDDVVAVFSVGVSSILSSRVFADVELGVGLTEAASDYTIRVAFPIQLDTPTLRLPARTVLPDDRRSAWGGHALGSSRSSRAERWPLSAPRSAPGHPNGHTPFVYGIGVSAHG